ncbi:endonuclease 8-like 1 isoform X2 [Brachyhypopomus gauderio]|uniref:endonuclease 8-like 1 isoform X2 n=1 Tax=Brachyhypopomus gauderio TaxID=698409 RepID=UPI0040425D85
MPEGPELHLASLFVNTTCADVVFTGAVEKSEISKGPEVPFASDAYHISAVSRGKEVKLTLTPIKVEELPKHAHLRFYTSEKPQRALSFVDARRFGSWQPNGSWQQNRGPCVLSEYENFRENVLSNLADKAFDRAICEALLNQKYFNGIGNYLRAEILHRISIPPFMKARTVLEGLEVKDEDTMIKEEKTESSDEVGTRKAKTRSPDLLTLCHTVPLEVVSLEGKGYDPEKRVSKEFEAWLQCYYVDGMNSVSDHNGRTMWFKGNPGPMVPKGLKSPKTKRKIQKDEHGHNCPKKGTKKKEAESNSKEKQEKEPRAEMKDEGATVRRRGSRTRAASKSGLDAEIAGDLTHADRATGQAGGPQKSRTRGTRSARGPAGNTKVKGITRPRRKSSRAT